MPRLLGITIISPRGQKKRGLEVGRIGAPHSSRAPGTI
jgi:hypothetical protein